MASVATLLSEAFINGRPIASYKLKQAIDLGDGHAVSVIELPAPKPGSAYAEGFEHIEVVTRQSLAEFIQAQTGLPLDLRNAKAKINADVSLRLPSGLVKFHETSLEAVIAAEVAALRRAEHRPLAVLDLDDTLLATRQPFLEAMRRGLSTLTGREVTPQEVVAGARPTFPEFFAAFGYDTLEARRQALAAYQRHWPAVEAGCSVPVGVHSLLSCLRSEGFALHVWTARDHETVEPCLARFGLTPLVDGVHAYDVESPGKPHPSAELAALCAARPNGSPVFMLGDSNTDRLAAQSLGATFLQATWVHHVPLKEDDHVRCTTPLAALTEMMALRRR